MATSVRELAKKAVAVATVAEDCVPSEETVESRCNSDL